MRIPTLFRTLLVLGCASLAACKSDSTGTGQVAVAPGVLQLAQSSYTVPVTAGTVAVQVARTGGADGSVSVNYATVDGTAVAGTLYTATSGTLTWADGDTADKTVSVTLKSATFSGNKTFQVAISAPVGGATLGTPAAATVAVTPASGGTSAGTVAISQASYTVAQSAGSVSVQVGRTGGVAGAVSVSYATSNGTAMAGTQYTAGSGMLSWADGDSAAKTIKVTLSTTAFSGSKTFNVAISSPVGGVTLGTPSTASVSITGSGGGTSGGTSGLSLKVLNGHFVDAGGNIVQLRGVNVSGLESVPLQGWSPGNPWGGQTGTPTPDWNLIKTWGVNAVRLPLNQASWLGYQCIKSASSTTLTNPDPGANYQATVLKSVADANAAGLYVILDLHWTGPNYNGTPICPTAQQPMADSDHSLDFWTSLATSFKSNPAVIFELFNEPFLGESARGDNTAAGSDIAYGTGSETAFILGGTVNATWTIAGMQQMLDAVRATGAKNPVLVGSDSWSQELVDFQKYPVTDSAGQLGAAWHPYPITLSGSSTPQARCVGLPACSAAQMQAAKDIIAAGYPVVITEFGDTISSSATANTDSPWSKILLPWADANGVSYLGWTWDVWTGFSANVLIKDAAGTPTNGYGAYVKQHLQCVAAGTANCP